MLPPAAEESTEWRPPWLSSSSCYSFRGYDFCRLRRRKTVRFTSGQNSKATFGASCLELRQSGPKWLTVAEKSFFAALAALSRGILWHRHRYFGAYYCGFVPIRPSAPRTWRNAGIPGYAPKQGTTPSGRRLSAPRAAQPHTPADGAGERGLSPARRPKPARMERPDSIPGGGLPPDARDPDRLCAHAQPGQARRWPGADLRRGRQ